jgi:hypothetical protein
LSGSGIHLFGCVNEDVRVALRLALCCLVVATVLTGCGAASTTARLGTVVGHLEGLGGPETIQPDGSITPPSPYPVGGSVTLVAASGFQASVSVGRTGTFSVRVPSGAYTVTGASAGNRLGDDCSAPAPVTVAPGSTTTITVGCATP